MKQQFVDSIPKLLNIPIILCVLLMVGCASEEEIIRAKKDYVPFIDISAPDLANPLSMSPRVGVNPNQKYQEVSKFSATFFDREKRVPNFIQGKMSEAVKGSERKAIKDIEIEIGSGAFLFLFTGGGNYYQLIKGSVIETQ